MGGGYFSKMVVSQGPAHPECDIDQEIAEKERKVQAVLGEMERDEFEVTAPSMQPVSLGDWMFDVVAELTIHKSHPHNIAPPRVSHIVRDETFDTFPHSRRPSSVYLPPLAIPEPAAVRGPHGRRLSLQFSPTSPISTLRSEPSYILDDKDSMLKRLPSRGL